MLKMYIMILKIENSMLLFSVYLFRFAYNLCPLGKVPVSKHIWALWKVSSRVYQVEVFLLGKSGF